MRYHFARNKRFSNQINEERIIALVILKNDLSTREIANEIGGSKACVHKILISRSTGSRDLSHREMLDF